MGRFTDLISLATLGYLAAPTFVFALGWMESLPGLIIVTLLAAALLQLVRQLPHRSATHEYKTWIWLLVLASLWAAFSGAGHFFYANPDWRTRDTVYADLILATGPPGYDLHDSGAWVLRTAMGYFLPPAMLTRLAGIGFAPLLLFIWTALGAALFLLLLPLPGRFGGRLVALGFLVIVFSGMDFPAIILIHGHVPIFPLPLEWWRQWTYTSLTGQLLWAPNHALALWLGTALFYRHRNDPILPALGLVLTPLLLLWTPFALVGLLPWFLWAMFRISHSTPSGLLRPKVMQWLFAVAMTAVLVFLFSRPGVEATLTLSDPLGSAQSPRTAAGILAQIPDYIQFAAFEFGLLSMLLRPRRSETRQALALAASLLLLLPLIRLGPSNDWLLRVSTPSLLILLILTLDEFEAPVRNVTDSMRRVGLIAVLALGAITPFFELSRTVLWPRTAPNYGQSLVEQQGFMPPHYIGRLDLSTTGTLLRMPSPVPRADQRQQMLPPSMRHPPS